VDECKLLKGFASVVTGSNRGIGKAILECFARNGSDVYACARQPSEAFENSLREVADANGVSITPIYFDLCDQEQVKSAIREITSSKKQIHVLVNNAGTASGGFFQLASSQELRRTFDINFFSQIQFTQGLSRYMGRFKSGSIINIASVAGLIGSPGTLSYGSSKAALMFATKTMATELGPSNIRVNAIAPSLTLTDMYEQMDEKSRNRMLESSALKRPAEAIEIANVALFLASNLSTYMTSQVLRVDGGLTT